MFPVNPLQMQGVEIHFIADIEAERVLSVQLKKIQNHVSQADTHAAVVASEVQQLQGSVLALTTTISDLLAATACVPLCCCLISK